MESQENLSEYFGEYEEDPYLPTGWALLMLCIVMLVMFLLFYLVSRWKLIAGVLIVVGSTYLSYLSMNWGLARLIVASTCLILVMLSFVIPQGQLENENCRMASVTDLWKSHKVRTFQFWSAGITFCLFILAAGLVDQLPNTSVNWPGVMIVAVICPVSMILIGYLTVKSHLIEQTA
ncbi:MAG: hypothetical protein WCT27_05030 [Patescibacteria group bacterium]